MDKNEMKSRISFALRDPVLQQGFECICKENADLKIYNEELYRLINAERKRQEQCDDVHLRKIAELEKENEELKLKEKLAGAERARDNLVQLGFPTFQSCKKYADKLTEAKEIIRKFVEWANWQGNSKCPSFKIIQDKAEQFLEGLKYEYRRNN